MTHRVMIITVPRQDVVRPPGILAILAACCEQVSADYRIFDLNLHMHKALPADAVDILNADFAVNLFSQGSAENYDRACATAVQEIKDYDPTIVAISVFTRQSILAAKAFLQYLRNTITNPRYKIVIGGLGVGDVFHDITGTESFGPWAVANALADHYITGEGELSFIEFLKGNLDYAGIDGRPNQQIMDLDELPSPSYKRIRPQDYFYSNAPEVLITGSKGCVRDCTFCNVGYYWEKYVYRSGIKIADDLYQIYKDTGVMKFDFSDSLINGSLKAFRQFNRRLIELREQDPGFRPQYKGQYICRPIGQMKDQDYVDMKLAGAETLIVGIEHFSEHIRTHMRKHFDNPSIDWHFAKCAELGIKNVLLMLSGYATESIEDHHINMEYLHRYQKYGLSRIIYAVNIAVSGLSIHKGMPLYEMAEEMGLLVTDDNWQTWLNLKNPELTPRERIRRAAEIVYTAGRLNYNVVHFNQKIADLKRYLADLDKEPAKGKTIPIMPAEFLS